MPVNLDDFYIEQSSGVVQCTFTDPDDNSVVPNSVMYTLSDLDGNVVNSRENVALSAATAVNIVFSAADLAMLSGETKDPPRIVTVVADYNSATYGNGLQLKESGRFYIKNLKVVT